MHHQWQPFVNIRSQYAPVECLVDLIQHAESSKINCKYNAVPSAEGMLLKMVTPNQ